MQSIKRASVMSPFPLVPSNGSGTFRHQPFGRQYGLGHMGDKSVDQIG